MKLKQFKAIIFDMDGTIVDTEHIWKRAIKELLAARNIHINEDHSNKIQNELKGIALEQSCAFIKWSFSLVDEISHLMQEKLHRANSLYHQEVKLMQGFVDFHKMAKQHNLKTGLATNAQPDTVHITNKVLNLEQFFGTHIYSIACVNNKGKPDPAIYLYAAQQLGVDPRHCIAIEDSSHGLTSAKRAGMFCIGYNSSKNRQQLQHADYIVDEYHEIKLEKFCLLPRNEKSPKNQ